MEPKNRFLGVKDCRWSDDWLDSSERLQSNHLHSQSFLADKGGSRAKELGLSESAKCYLPLGMYSSLELGWSRKRAAYWQLTLPADVTLRHSAYAGIFEHCLAPSNP